jgi:ATP-dependent RNA helicase RhlE
MLDMGFIHDIRRIVPKLPKQRQTLLFSATMPPDIRDLARTILHNPVSVQVAPVSSTADRIEQFVYFVEKRNKPRLLAHVLSQTAFSRCLVFTRTKHGADRVAKHLNKAGIDADAIHGNKSQNQRERALANFKSGKTGVLVASDIASRGIDIDDISHVVNFDLSNEPETYVHRIGRTARAGASGVAISFCDNDERPYLADIEKLTRQKLVVKADHPTYPAANEAVARAMGQHPSSQPPRHPPQPRRVPHGNVHAPRHPAAHQPAQPRTDTPASPEAPRHAASPRRSHPLHAAQGAGVRFHCRKRGARR